MQKDERKIRRGLQTKGAIRNTGVKLGLMVTEEEQEKLARSYPVNKKILRKKK